MGFHVDTTGNVWLGSGTTGTTLANAIAAGPPTFYVTTTGSVVANAGTIGGLTLDTSGISANYSSGSTGFKIFSADGSAEFNNVTVRGTLDGPTLTGNMSGGTSGTISVGASGDEVKIIEDSTAGGFITFNAGNAQKASLSFDGSSEFQISSGLNTDISINSQGADLYLLSDRILFRDYPTGNDTPKIYLWNGSSYDIQTNKVLGTDSSGNLTFTTQSTSPVQDISGSGDISVSESSGSYTISHSDSDHSFASTSSVQNNTTSITNVSSSLTSHSNDSTAHGSFDNYGSWTLRGNPSGNLQTSTIGSGNSASVFAGSGITASMSGSSITLNASGVTSIGQSGTDGFVTSVSGSTVNTSPTLGNILIRTGSHYPESSFNTLGAFNTRWYRLYAQVATSVSSDERLKENIADINQGLDFINDLRPVEFTWKDVIEYACEDYPDDKYIEKKDFCSKCQKENDIAYSDYLLEKENFDNEVIEDEPTEPTFTACTWIETTTDINEDKKSWGMLAQEVETSLDGYEGQVLNYDTENDIYGLSYSSFVAPLIKAVQELSTQISDLTARVEALEG